MFDLRGFKGRQRLMDANGTTLPEVQTDNAPKEFCRIVIVFPVYESTDVMTVKRKMQEALANVDKATLTMVLANVPTPLPS